MLNKLLLISGLLCLLIGQAAEARQLKVVAETDSFTGYLEGVGIGLSSMDPETGQKIISFRQGITILMYPHYIIVQGFSSEVGELYKVEAGIKSDRNWIAGRYKISAQKAEQTEKLVIIR